ncbi:MAG: TetR/AcrR family transcriptional regulator [Cyanobacteria bacterium P01_D01_bin.123]
MSVAPPKISVDKPLVERYPRRKASGPTKGERTREALADTAAKILKERGYPALTIASLADGAGIQRNSYYTHFRDLSELIDRLSLKLLNQIGRKSVSLRSRNANHSAVLERLKFVLSLAEMDPSSGAIISELYTHHSTTAQEIHRRLKLDLAMDRRRGLTTIAGREADVASMVLASGTIQLLRQYSDTRKNSLLLALLAKMCSYRTDALQ